MNFFKQLTLGIRSYKTAHDFIRYHKLWLYVFLPGIINILLFGLVTFVAWHYSSSFTDWLFIKMGINPTADGGIWKSVVTFFLIFIVRMAIITAYLYMYKYIVLIIMSPVLAFLSEKTEFLATGKSFYTGIGQILKDIARGLIIAIRNSFIELLFLILLFFISYIPMMGILTPLLAFIVQFYFYGFSMIDYSLERRRMNIKETNQTIFKYKGIAIANGAIFYVSLLIPIAGLLVAPTYSVVAGTLALIEAEAYEK